MGIAVDNNTLKLAEAGLVLAKECILELHENIGGCKFGHDVLRWYLDRQERAPEPIPAKDFIDFLDAKLRELYDRNTELVAMGEKALK